MATYIGTIDSKDESRHKEARSLCDGCRHNPGKSYCDDCDQIFCENCSTVHGNISRTKLHKLISWDEYRQAKEPEIDKHIKSFKDECTAIEKKLSAKEDESWAELFSARRAEIEKIRVETISKVNDHHSYLLEQINSADTACVEQMDKEVNVLKQAKLSLERKQANIRQVSECGDILFLKNLLAELEKDSLKQLQELKGNVAEAENYDRLSEVYVMKEMQWNSKTSTRIEMVYDNGGKTYKISHPDAKLELSLSKLLTKARTYSESLGMEIQTRMEWNEKELNDEKALLAERENVIKQLQDENTAKEKRLQDLIEDINQTKTQMESNEDELNKAKALLSEKENIIKQLQEEHTAKEKKVQDLKEEIKQTKTQMKWNENESNRAKALLAEKENVIKLLRDKHTATERKVQELKKEVKQTKSAEAKLATDENAWKSMNIVDQPIKIAEDYRRCLSDEWLEIMQKLEKNNMTPENAHHLLRNILKMSYEKCEETVQSVKAGVMQLLSHPGTGTRGFFDSTYLGYSAHARNARPAVSHTLSNVVSYSMSRTAHEVNLDAIYQEVSKNVQADFPSWKMGRLRNDDALKKYIEASLRICWRMVLQCPAMIFCTDGVKQKWNQEAQEPCFGSDPDKKGALVRYYVHPVLMQGGRVLVKGKVMVK